VNPGPFFISPPDLCLISASSSPDDARAVLCAANNGIRSDKKFTLPIVPFLRKQSFQLLKM